MVTNTSQVRDMLQSKYMAILWLLLMAMYLNTALSWQICLTECSKKMSMSTILTRTNSTTIPKTLGLHQTETIKSRTTVTNDLTQRKRYEKEYVLDGVICNAYCHCTQCTSGLGVTAAGNRPQAGVTIAGPRAYPIGSICIIGSKRFIIQDRTAKRFDGRFDIYFKSHAEARRFGIRTNQVTVITK